MNSEKKNYYDHDATWKKRRELGTPIWGSYSYKMYREVLDAILEFHKEHELSVLDIGCGAGAFGEFLRSTKETTALSDQEFSFLGIDSSNEAIELGKERFNSLNLECIDFASGPCPVDFHRRFSVVTAINVLHCLVKAEHRLQMLKNLQACLKPGGLSIVTGMIKPVLDDYRETINARYYADRDELIAEYKEVGLGKIVFERTQLASGRAKISNHFAILSLS
ncbi:MAG: class I SAM-dependent methyltransferase [Oligoflexales bacterium]|nr:class I SAM-dependent methyltransferase [Oligoflexales bacterium]